VGTGAAALFASAVRGRASAEVVARFDVVIRGGTVLDGTGAPAYPADVGVRGDQVAAVGRIGDDQASLVIDATSHHVCPGFIDIHTHSDGGILTYPGADSRVRQGITTELAGNCGSSAAPIAPSRAEELRREYAEDGVTADWTDVASYLARLDRSGIAINQALLLGQGTLRRNAIGNLDRPLTAGERAAILRAVEEGLEADGTFVAMNNRISQSVAHLHVHVVPRHRKDGLRGFFWPRITYASEAEAQHYAERIAKALPEG